MYYLHPMTVSMPPFGLKLPHQSWSVLSTHLLVNMWVISYVIIPHLYAVWTTTGCVMQSGFW